MQDGVQIILHVKETAKKVTLRRLHAEKWIVKDDAITSLIFIGDQQRNDWNDRKCFFINWYVTSVSEITAKTKIGMWRQDFYGGV